MNSIDFYNYTLEQVNKKQELFEEWLHVEAVEFLEENFRLELTATINLNGRIKKSLGRFRRRVNVHTGEIIELSIEISKMVMVHSVMTENLDLVKGVLKHELIHYALWKLNKPFKDTDPYFINTCKELGAPVSHEIRVPTPLNVYKCEHGHKTYSVNKFDTDNYICKECFGKFEYLGQELV